LGLIVDILNSAIEATVDRVSLEIHPLAKRAKDRGSAAQFLALSLIALVWGTILLSGPAAPYRRRSTSFALRPTVESRWHRPCLQSVRLEIDVSVRKPLSTRETLCEKNRPGTLPWPCRLGGRPERPRRSDRSQILPRGGRRHAQGQGRVAVPAPGRGAAG